MDLPGLRGIQVDFATMRQANPSTPHKWRAVKKETPPQPVATTSAVPNETIPLPNSGVPSPNTVSASTASAASPIRDVHTECTAAEVAAIDNVAGMGFDRGLVAQVQSSQRDMVGVGYEDAKSLLQAVLASQ